MRARRAGLTAGAFLCRAIRLEEARRGPYYVGGVQMVSDRELVLLIEDDDDLRAVETAILEQAGFRVATARDGGEALERVAEEMPGVIFLDMRMPGMDGWEFARQFRAKHDHGAPLVVVTAESSARARAAEISAEGSLGKPFNARDLMSMARQYVHPESRPR
jgi:two-component system, chemotaxis family, chemotaxis protein CheY